MKLLAEWFWVDRWMGSSAFALPLEARGLYREMLSQAWRRGAQLPNDHEQIRRMTGVTPKEWARNWRLVERFWRVEGDCLINETQREVYAETSDRVEVASRQGINGGRARAAQGARNARGRFDVAQRSTSVPPASTPAHQPANAPARPPAANQRRTTPPISVSSLQEEEGPPTVAPSDAGDVRSQDHRRRVAPVRRAQRAASAPVDDPLLKDPAFLKLSPENQKWLKP